MRPALERIDIHAADDGATASGKAVKLPALRRIALCHGHGMDPRVKPEDDDGGEG